MDLNHVIAVLQNEVTKHEALHNALSALSEFRSVDTAKAEAQAELAKVRAELEKTNEQLAAARAALAAATQEAQRVQLDAQTQAQAHVAGAQKSGSETLQAARAQAAKIVEAAQARADAALRAAEDAIQAAVDRKAAAEAEAQTAQTTLAELHGKIDEANTKLAGIKIAARQLAD